MNAGPWREIRNQRFPIKIIHVCARLFTGFLPDKLVAWKTAANR